MEAIQNSQLLSSQNMQQMKIYQRERYRDKTKGYKERHTTDKEIKREIDVSYTVLSNPLLPSP